VLFKNVGARFWDIPPLPPKCEIFPLLKPKGAANCQLVGSMLGEKSQGSCEIPLEYSGLCLSELSGYDRPTTTNTVGDI